MLKDLFCNRNQTFPGSGIAQAVQVSEIDNADAAIKTFDERVNHED